MLVNKNFTTVFIFFCFVLIVTGFCYSKFYTIAENQDKFLKNLEFSQNQDKSNHVIKLNEKFNRDINAISLLFPGNLSTHSTLIETSKIKVVFSINDYEIYTDILQRDKNYIFIKLPKTTFNKIEIYDFYEKKLSKIDNVIFYEKKHFYSIKNKLNFLANKLSTNFFGYFLFSIYLLVFFFLNNISNLNNKSHSYFANFINIIFILLSISILKYFLNIDLSFEIFILINLIIIFQTIKNKRKVISICKKNFREIIIFIFILTYLNLILFNKDSTFNVNYLYLYFQKPLENIKYFHDISGYFIDFLLNFADAEIISYNKNILFSTEGNEIRNNYQSNLLNRGIIFPFLISFFIDCFGSTKFVYFRFSTFIWCFTIFSIYKLIKEVTNKDFAFFILAIMITSIAIGSNNFNLEFSIKYLSLLFFFIGLYFHIKKNFSYRNFSFLLSFFSHPIGILIVVSFYIASILNKKKLKEIFVLSAFILLFALFFGEKLIDFIQTFFNQNYYIKNLILDLSFKSLIYKAFEIFFPIIQTSTQINNFNSFLTFYLSRSLFSFLGLFCIYLYLVKNKVHLKTDHISLSNGILPIIFVMVLNQKSTVLYFLNIYMIIFITIFFVKFYSTEFYKNNLKLNILFFIFSIAQLILNFYYLTFNKIYTNLHLIKNLTDETLILGYLVLLVNFYLSFFIIKSIYDKK